MSWEPTRAVLPLIVLCAHDHPKFRRVAVNAEQALCMHACQWVRRCYHWPHSRARLGCVDLLTYRDIIGLPHSPFDAGKTRQIQCMHIVMIFQRCAADMMHCRVAVMRLIDFSPTAGPEG